jgi:hypothetical protein
MKKNNKDNKKTGQCEESEKDKNSDFTMTEDDICKRIEKYLEDADNNDNNDNKEKIVVENFID